MQRLSHKVSGRLALGLALAAGFCAAGTARAGTEVYHLTRHADRTAGVNRDAAVRVGHCMQCHVTRQQAPFAQTYALFGPNDNSLCFTCHTGPGRYGIFEGPANFNATAHWTSGLMLWPGPTPPARPAGDQGKCLNCHTPHGSKDGQGLVPSQGYVREEALCLACHDSTGPASSNISGELAKAAAHPVIPIFGAHAASEGGSSAAFGGAQRHSECVDCHNPHRAKAGYLAPPTSSNPLLGVGRVKVTNGGAGTAPAYTYLPPTDTTTPYEYELCFKCHSSWTTLPAGAKDKALELNPANASFHPVEAAGKNATPAMAASLAGGSGSPTLTTTSTLWCTDCHNSEAIPATVSTISSYTGTAVRGPHGSNASAAQATLSKSILRAAYRVELKATAAANDYNVGEFALCTICHSAAPFADASKSTRADTNYRFHGFHLNRLYRNPAGGGAGGITTPGAGQGNAICRECHYDPHGTAGTFYATNRNNARLVSFAPNITGPGGVGAPQWAPGSCTLRCHGFDHTPETY